MKKVVIAVALLLVAASGAHAHTPLCSCFDNGDSTITCEGGFSDGSSAAGVAVRVEDGKGGVLREGKMDADSEFTFDRPSNDFQVVFDAGEGHRIVVPSKEII